jgi:hypothetical protein
MANSIYYLWAIFLMAFPEYTTIGTTIGLSSHEV